MGLGDGKGEGHGEGQGSGKGEGTGNDTYYDYSSNNCTDIVNKANPGNINVESTQCRDSIEETLDGVPLQDKDIRVGLPPQTEASHDNVTWAFLHVIQNAAIDYKGNIFIADGRLEPFQCYRKWQPRCDNDEIKKMRYYDEVFTIKSLWSSYYHVTIDQFARLVFYKEFLAANPHIILHCSKPHPFLDILGLRGIQVASGNISARIVYAPGAMPCGMASLFQTQLLSAVLRSRLPVDVSRRNVVLIKRSTRRCFTHHSDILAMLEKHSADVGLAVSVFSDNPLPSVEETRIMFHNAIIVVAPHGAGEANIILCSPRTVLIEGLCRDGDNRLTLCYRNLARVLGMHYHGLVPRNKCMDTTASDIEIDNFSDRSSDGNRYPVSDIWSLPADISSTSTGTTDEYVFFRGRMSDFSNVESSHFNLDGIYYSRVEQYLQRAKALSPTGR
ncbi:hypothetical protein LSH36_285g00012 [Paralvinella palmiformis]|uniref:Glycosyltransferase 61 catalytic domain-containing protein n=1 Tax=Paralvinella palmiformis TaxID=53620 RepID=A0AAD9JJE6_9ANNE|nr:hypothetical protein LSH36_285g00012 [Paralvinella palmiformis]